MALDSEVGPTAEGDTPFVEEDRRGIVPETESAAVEPGEEACLRWRVTDVGQVALEQLRKGEAVAVQLLENGVEPELRLAEGSDAPEHSQVAREQRLPSLGKDRVELP